MNRRKSKRSMLLSSFVSLMLCMSMLVGTTFAWFADSVSSGMNVIATGNLDVELEYWNGSKWETAAAASDILTGDKWEPGYTDVAYLRIKNVGNLALSYQLGVNIQPEKPGTNMAGEEFLLSDYIYFDVSDVNGEVSPYQSREDAMKIATNTTKISQGYSKANSLEPGSAYDYVAMVVYMPTEVGNKANNNGKDIPEINLGIHLTATQVPHEFDSFGKDYDSGANNGPIEIPLSQGGTASGEAPAANETKTYPIYSTNSQIQVASMSISSESIADLNKKVNIYIQPVALDTTFSNNVTLKSDQTAESYDFSVTNIKDENNQEIQVKLNYRTGLTGVQVFHNNEGTIEEITPINYNAVTGEISFATTSFSPYTIVRTVNSDVEDDGNGDGGEGGSGGSEEGGSVDEEKALKEAIAKGGTVTLSSNITLNTTLAISNTVTIDLNGYTIACGTDNSYIQITGDGNLTIADSGSAGSITGWNNDNGKTMCGVINMGSVTVNGGTITGGILNHGGAVTMNNGTIASDFTGFSTDGGSITVNGGSVSGSMGGIQIDPFESKNAANVTITGGTVNGGITTYFYDNAQYGPINISGGTINGGVMNNGTLTVTGGVINDGINNHGGTVTVENGTITSGFTGIYSDSGSVTIKGGSVHGNNQGICNDYNRRDSKASIVTVEGGSVTCGEPNPDGTGPVKAGILNYASSEVYVTGGHVTSLGIMDNPGNPYKGTISVTGGTFQQDPSGFLATGYKSELNSQNLYVVSKD